MSAWNECIERLYDAVGVERTLAEALGAFRPFFDSQWATFLTTPSFATKQSMHIASADVPTSALVDYHSHFYMHDEWVKAAWSSNGWTAGAAYRGSDLISRIALKKTYFWSDFLSHYGVVDILTAVVETAEVDGRASVVTFHRTGKKEPYSTQLVRLLSQLAPHLRRALRLHRRLAPELAVGATLHELFNEAEQPMFFVDREGFVVEMNSAAQEALELAQPLMRVGRGQLYYREGAKWQDVRSALGLFWPSDAVARDLDAWSEDDSTSLTVRKVGAAITDKLAHHPAAAVCLLHRTRDSDERHLQRRYGLTGAEIKIAKLLSTGRSPAQIASHLRISVETVRTHLKNLFSKTDTRRQAELVVQLFGLLRDLR